MKQEKMEKVVFLITMFLMFSMIGWLWELLYDFLKHGVIANHGVLHGPWLPIYGTGGVVIYLLLNRYKKYSIIVFMGSFVFCTIIEYLTGWYLETYKHHKWWSYSYMPFNIDGRVCLLSSVFFGAAGLACIYIFAPRLKKIIKKYDFKTFSIICLTLIFIFIIDFIHSSFRPNIVEKYKIIDTEKVNEIRLFKK